MKPNIAIFLILILFSCSSRTQQKDSVSIRPLVVETNPYLNKYAGGYTVELKGLSVSEIDDYAEVYVLGSGGQAKWMMIKNSSNGEAIVKSEQTGIWMATETTISITAGKGVESSIENFVLKDGKFINIETDTNIPLAKRQYRYLKLMVKSK